MDTPDNNPLPYRPQARNRYAAYMPLIYSLLVAMGILMGMAISSVTAGKRKPLQSGGSSKIDDIINFVKVKYVDTVNAAQITDVAIDKMLSSLDPHSVYIPARDVSQVNEPLEGNFEGVGIEFFIVQDTITVVAAIAGGPSELIGIRAGDRIITINDTSVAGKKIKNEDVVHKLRGIGGSKVRVGIMRSGARALIPYTITRDKIPLYSIDAAYMIDARTGYIKINRFSATTYNEFRRKLHDLTGRGMRNLVIDLRQNPGGYLNAATEIVDELLNGDKLIVFTKGKSVDRVDYKASRPGEFENGKLAILIDQGSASASEIVSGAVQDWDRGTILGRTSFGKGLVQEQYELPDGSGLRLTVARYYTPSGRCIQRPYNKGADEYYNEINERYLKGEFVKEDSIPLSDTTTYHTANGRVVHGGGGIKPDVFVPLDTTEDYDYQYRIRVFIPEFIYSHYAADPTILSSYSDMQAFKAQYHVSPAMSSAFRQYLLDHKFKMDEARYAKVAHKTELLIKAYLAKQKWQSDGFYYMYNEDDKVMLRALETFTKATK
jgi:carboxyl-terminal processing protease